MLNLKKLISLSLYLNKNSLIKESSYLKSLIKESGYDWKEMGKAPHLKKDEPYKEKIDILKDNDEFKKKEDDILRENYESDSWLDEKYDIKNEPINLNIYEDSNEESSEKSSERKYMPTSEGLSVIKEEILKKPEIFHSKFLILAEKYKEYIPLLAEQFPFHFLIELSKQEKYKKEFNNEEGIARFEIKMISEKARETLGLLISQYGLKKVAEMLGDYSGLIILNRPLLLYLSGRTPFYASQTKELINSCRNIMIDNSFKFEDILENSDRCIKRDLNNKMFGNSYR